MKTRVILATCALIVTYALGAVPTAQAAGAVVKFGIGTDGLDAMANAGVKADYTQTWVGEWMTRSGWSGFDNALKTAKAKGATLVVQWYYWGDGINSGCVNNGCGGKDRGEWFAMTRTMSEKIKASGASTIVIVESEFNKNDIDDGYAATFDGYMADVHKTIKSIAPGAKTAVGFGNWGQSNWGKFPKTVAAADYTGFQAMAASTRHSVQQYLATDDTIESTTKLLKSKFGKPVILHDLALASYPDSTWRTHQNEFMKQLFARMGTLASSGLEGIVWRYYTDNCYSSGYFGAAECYWGMADRNGSPKPSWHTWVAGIKAHRGSGGYTPPPSTTPPPSGASVSISASLDATTATLGGKLSGTVTLKNTGGSGTTLQKVVLAARPPGGTNAGGPYLDFGTAMNVWVGAGETKTLRFTRTFSTSDPTGSWYAYGTYQSQSGAWTDSSQKIWFQVSKPGTTGGFTATFSPSKSGNNWWVETYVSGNQGIASVSASVNGGAPVALSKTAWGSWAKSFHVPTGAKVVFTAKSTSGATATSAAYAWPVR